MGRPGQPDRLGAGEVYSEGRDTKQWLAHMYEEGREKSAKAGVPFPSFDEFWQAGIADVERGQLSVEPEAVAMTVDQHLEETVTRRPGSDLSTSIEQVKVSRPNAVAWGGVANHYFAALVAPSLADRERVIAAVLSATVPDDPQTVRASLHVSR